MTHEGHSADEIKVVVAHAFGKKVVCRLYGTKGWMVVPEQHKFNFEECEYIATDEQLYLRKS